MARMFDPRFERRKTGAQAHFGLEIRVLLNLPQLVVFLLGQLDASRWWHSPIISLRYLVGDRLPHQLGPLDDQLRRPVFLRAYLPLVIFESSGHMTFVEENDA